VAFGKNCRFSCDCVKNNTASCNPVTGGCTCLEGWTAANCSTDIDECKELLGPVCPSSSEKCVNTLGGYNCICKSGNPRLPDGSCGGEFMFNTYLFAGSYKYKKITIYLTLLSCRIVFLINLLSSLGGMRNSIDYHISPESSFSHTSKYIFCYLILCRTINCLTLVHIVYLYLPYHRSCQSSRCSPNHLFSCHYINISWYFACPGKKNCSHHSPSERISFFFSRSPISSVVMTYLKYMSTMKI
jgi:hypothetical protein